MLQKAENIIKILKAFESGFMDKHFNFSNGYYTDHHRIARCIVYEKDYKSRHMQPLCFSNEYVLLYMCENAGDTMSYMNGWNKETFLLSDYDLEYPITEESYFQYCLLYKEHIVSTLNLYYLLKKNFNYNIYFDMRFYNECLGYINA